MTQKRHDYRSYLLRLWRAGEEDEAVWRASLERSDTHRRHGFASLEELFEFLRAETGALLEVDGGKNEKS
jgi:hypothetical protein